MQFLRQHALSAMSALIATATTAVFTMATSPVGAQTPPAAEEEPPPKFEASFLSSPKSIEEGRGVWDGQCKHCHGNSAYPGKAPKLKPGSYTPDFIYDRVTYGFRGMPPWKAVYTIDQRMAVVAYIKSDSFSP
jgi:mono/diheme cytochrome c family protein